MSTLLALLLNLITLSSSWRNWRYRSPTSPTVAPVPTVAPLICEIGDYEYTIKGITDYSTWTSTRDTNCPSGWYCGALEYDIKYNVTGNDLYGIPGNDRSWSDQTILHDQYCADEVGCALYADGTDGTSCQTANWQYDHWQPTTCDETQDFNALNIAYNIDASFFCCDSDECNRDVVFGCEQNDTLSSYISELYGCWNEYQRDFMTDIWCDDELYDYYVLTRECCDKDSCVNRRSRRHRKCRWKWRCSDDLRNIIEQYGKCACQAARNNSFDGTMISEMVKNEWAELCPNVDVSCNPPSALPTVNPTIQNSLDIYWWYVSYKFALRSGKDQKAEDLEELILETIANRTGTDTSSDTDSDDDDDVGIVVLTTPDPSSSGPVDRRRRRTSEKRLAKAFKYLRKPIKLSIKPLNNEKRRQLQETNCSSNTLTEEERLGCDDTYVDCAVTFELQSNQDADNVAEICATEMDGTIEDATGGTVYDSVVETWQETDHVILDPDTGEEIIYDDNGDIVSVNQTVDYDNYDDEVDSDSKSNANIISIGFISIICCIVALIHFN